MPLSKIKVCYIPGRESTYVRTRVILSALKNAGFEVYDCSYPKRVYYRYIFIIWKFLKYKNKCDIVYVGFLAQFLMPLVKLLTKKKIIFEAFVSVYQTLAFDRKSINPHGILAKIVRWIEQKDCRWADCIYLDTQQQIDYFKKEYHLEDLDIKRSWVSCDETLLYPREKEPGDKFLIHFHGEFQALHGTRYIVKAAKLLADIQFRMIGTGRELKDCQRICKKEGIRNIEFINAVAYSDLPNYIAQADICLGIFGETQKTQLVIPFKVYEGLAMAKPVITADTPAVRELLQHKENVYLCKTADPESLAQAIKTIKNNNELRERIALNGYNTFKMKCSNKMIIADIQETIKKLLNKTS